MRSPKASEGQGGALGEAEALRRGNTVGVRDQVMDLVAGQGLPVSRVADNELMGTPRTSSANAATQKQIDANAPKSRIEDQVLTAKWGKFELAIRRWEQVLGRPAPAPTKPDGKEGAHRLSSAFTEWMMGLPEGWITDCGLSRNEELKACGNGVVPQQAELALRMLLDGIELTIGNQATLLPTPTAVDGNTVAKSELDANDPKHRLKVAVQVLARDNRGGGDNVSNTNS